MKKTAVVMVSIFLAAGVWAMGSKEGIKSDTRATTVSAAAETPAASGGNTNTVKTVNQSQSSGSQQTIKTEQQAPGVVVEYKEDGTKVVTINLSEVDENKLPEKYDAKVILEAPVYEIEYIKANSEKLKNTIYFAYIKDIVMPQDVDVKVGQDGSIYIFDPYMNRVRKFDTDGKHLKDIPVNNKRKVKRLPGGYYEAESMTDEIEVGGDRVYLRDTAKNSIEALDESGKVLETIEVPEAIEGKKTREMKMWADEEGVGIGKPSMNLRFSDGERIRKKGEEKWGEVSLKAWHTNTKYYSMPVAVNDKLNWRLNDDIEFLLRTNKGTIISVNELMRNKNDIVLSAGVFYGLEGDVLKIKNSIISITNGKVSCFLADFNQYWRDSVWVDECRKNPLTWSGNTYENLKAARNGNVYLLQKTCCKEKDCIYKIRFIILQKGNK